MKRVLGGGLFAGLLDIVAAFVVFGARGAPALRILQAIASGILGAAAFEGGIATAAVGLVLHFGIAVGWSAVFYALRRSLPWISQKPLVSGALFGAAVYFLMNLVVVPLSAVSPRPFSLDVVILIVHVLCVGIPIALIQTRPARV
jgi:uncharacterized membrane protein YagU involved in acid resistance